MIDSAPTSTPSVTSLVAYRQALARFVRTSLPIGGQWLLDMTTFAIFTSLVARMGAASMAASQAMLQLLSLSFMQAVAIASASGTLVGRYLGAGDTAAASRSFRSAQTLALALGAVVAVLFLSAPQMLLGIFADDLEVLMLARPLLTLGALFQVLDAVGIVASGSLRGALPTRSARFAGTVSKLRNRRARPSLLTCGAPRGRGMPRALRGSRAPRCWRRRDRARRRAPRAR